MKKLLPLIIILGSLTIFASFKGIFALFTSSAHSSNNTFTAAAVFPSLTPIPVHSGDVVINEINWEGSNGDGNDEWIELKNTTTHDIDLKNWIVNNLGSGSGNNANITIATTSSTISAHGFYLISQHNKADSKINVDPQFVTTAISLNNNGEQLTLIDNHGTIIDTANSTGAWFAGSNSSPKKSMERIDSPSIGDGTVSTSWKTATQHINMDGNSSTDEFGSPGADTP